MNISSVFLSSLIGYLLGCIQTAYILGKTVKSIDIRQHGSNNAGASNVVNVMGWKYGIITAIVDILKAILAVFFVRLLFPSNLELQFIAGAFSILGHNFPFFLKFKGGKGAASLIGMIIAFDLRIGVLLIITIITLTLLTDYIALGTIAMATILPLAIYVLDYSPTIYSVSLLLAIVFYFKHITNIKKIIRHEEVGLRAVIKKYR